MKLNKKNFFLILKNNFLFENNPNIAVAVSGGPDSMALVYLLNEWIKNKKGKITALLIDHGLRNDSYYECKITKKYLKSLNINSKIITIPLIKLNKKNMNEARNNRYDKLISFCKNNNILHLFLGHHFDDNLETFLIRKIAGSNLEGLGSMSFSSFRKNIQLVRPFLNFTKNEIIGFNKINKIKYINDPSNYNEKFSRAFIRNYLYKTKQIKIIKKEFEDILKFINPYKIMIYEKLNKLILKIKKKYIILSFQDFIKLDIEIKEKIIEKIYYYLNQKNRKIRFSKIKNSLFQLTTDNFKSTNLASMIVQKDKNLLYFSIKK